MTTIFPSLSGSFVYLEPLQEKYREVLRPMARDERLWEFTKTLLIDTTYDAQFDAYFNVALELPALGGQAFIIRALKGMDPSREVGSGARAEGSEAGERQHFVMEEAEEGLERREKGSPDTGAKGQIIGMTRLFAVEVKDKRLEIGHTWYIPEVWGKVYNKECKLLLLQYAFETLGFNRVEFRVAHQNIRSQKAVEKIGGVKEGVLRKFAIRNDGSRRDTVVFSIIDEEWPGKKQRLKELIAQLA